MASIKCTKPVGDQMEVIQAMRQVNETESKDPIHRRALNLFNTFFIDPSNKTCINKAINIRKGVKAAPIHLAARLENVVLLELFKNNNHIDVNVNFVEDGEKQGNVLDMVTY